MNYIEKKSKITHDKYTEYVFQAYDIQDREETVVKIPINFAACKQFDWQIGVIYGGSGTGKTTLLKEFGEIKDIQLDESKSLISNFDFLEPQDATRLLASIGLSSVPTWLRPFHTLSNGEQYRAMLAYKIGKAQDNDVILIDEYTSVVDRDVAKSMSYALQRYIRKSNKKIILASCHFDIMEWLMPDWTYSPLKGRVERCDYLRQGRPKIKLSIFRCRYETWDIFKSHHYLTEDLNKAAKCFMTMWNDKPIGFNAVLPMPSGTVQNAYRMSRTVILPDFQGLGIGARISDYIASLYKADNKKFYVKTANPALWKHREKCGKWRLTHQVNNVDEIKKYNEKYKDIDNGLKLRREAITKSFEYIGEPGDERDLPLIQFDSQAYINDSQQQIKMF